MPLPNLFNSMLWHALPGALLLAYAVGWYLAEVTR